jgi:hypothetical protein
MIETASKPNVKEVIYERNERESINEIVWNIYE